VLKLPQPPASPPPGRAIAGVGAATLGIGSSYITQTTTSERRQLDLGRYRVTQNVARMAGPFVGYLFIGLPNVSPLRGPEGRPAPWLSFWACLSRGSMPQGPQEGLRLPVVKSFRSCIPCDCCPACLALRRWTVAPLPPSSCSTGENWQPKGTRQHTPKLCVCGSRSGQLATPSVLARLATLCRYTIPGWAAFVLVAALAVVFAWCFVDPTEENEHLVRVRGGAGRWPLDPGPAHLGQQCR
jgi:MFS family permease